MRERKEQRQAEGRSGNVNQRRAEHNGGGENREIIREEQSEAVVKRRSETEGERPRTETSRRERGRERERNRSGGSAPVESRRVSAAIVLRKIIERATPLAQCGENHPVTYPHIAQRALLRSGEDESSAGRGGARRVSSCSCSIREEFDKAAAKLNNSL